MPILMALLIAATPPEFAIRSETIGEGRYRILLAAPGLTLEQGQAAAMREAMRLCGGGPATLGHYRWQSEERTAGPVGQRTPVSLALEQEAACGAAPSPPVTGPTGWAPSATDMTNVLDYTARYFAARDAGRYGEAWGLLTRSMQDMSPLSKFQTRLSGFNERSGGRAQRRPVAVTWYDNPPNAPVAGIFAAVDFVGEAEDLQLICGYLVWLRQPDGQWRLAREEEGTLERKVGRGMTAEQLAQAKAAMGCRDPG